MWSAWIPNAPTGSEPFAYDAADNVIKLNTTTQQFNAADQLCWTVAGASGNACATAPSGATTYAYDTRGNRTSQVRSTDAATCDGYDQANRLVTVKTGTGTSCTAPTTVGTYSYNGAGLRMGKTVAGVSTTETWDLAGGLPLLLEDKTSSSTLDYVYGPSGLPLEQISGTTTLWYHHDQLARQHGGRKERQAGNPAELGPVQWLCVRPNSGQGICQLVRGLLGDCGFRRTRLAPTTGMVDLKDDGLLPELDDPARECPPRSCEGSLWSTVKG